MKKILAMAGMIALLLALAPQSQAADQVVTGNLTVTGNTTVAGSFSAAAQGTFFGAGRNTATSDVNLIFGNFPTAGQFAQFFWKAANNRWQFSNPLHCDGTLSTGSTLFVNATRNTQTNDAFIVAGNFPTAGQFEIIKWSAASQRFEATDDMYLDGEMSAKVVEIRGGSDLSEQFNVSGQPQPGMVVSIDPKNPGELMVCSEANDHKVAGVISGAGGLNPGMVMGQAGTKAHGDHPVALTGRVYCYVDASKGAVQPGDMLTTSATPGHAMKVQEYDAARGAIIGKAMTGLDKGRGLVLVLVNLQ